MEKIITLKIIKTKIEVKNINDTDDDNNNNSK